MLGWRQHKTTCKNIWRTKENIEENRALITAVIKGVIMPSKRITDVIILTRMITGVIMFYKISHGHDRNRGRKERKKGIPGSGHGLAHGRDGGATPWSRA